MFIAITKKRFLLFYFLIIGIPLFAQNNLYLFAPYTTKMARAKMMEIIIQNTIIGNLSSPLDQDNEYKWQEAFDALETYQFKNSFVSQKIQNVFDNLTYRSISFQRALLELAYSNYPKAFIPQVQSILNQTTHPKIFAMSAEYLMQASEDSLLKHNLLEILFAKFGDTVYENPILYSLLQRLTEPQQFVTQQECIYEIMKPTFLANQKVVFSFQRKNRNYPGMVLVRDSSGNFLKDSSGQFFHIPQLARSISNLPGYLTNGNTPQGIFSMNGWGVSMSAIIGPTKNVQMGMPIEVSLQQFFHDSTLSDSTWSLEYYQQLIPKNIQGYTGLYEAYYAGLAGRTEIIAHGTTIDPELYANQPYYPLTPTQGCLCTKEIWDGNRIESDQQKLVNALQRLGEPIGFVVVIELDDKSSPVILQDLKPFLPK
jgi:hypothetical protein